MAAAEVISKTSYHADPAGNASFYQISYSKAAQSDTIDVSSYTPIKTIAFVLAIDDSAGAIDETTWSGTTVTLTGAEIGAGSLIVVGTC